VLNEFTEPGLEPQTTHSGLPAKLQQPQLQKVERPRCPRPIKPSAFQSEVWQPQKQQTNEGASKHK